MNEWAYLLKTGIALFAIVNPVGGLTVFISATERWTDAERRRTARTVGLTVFTVLILSVFIGDALLDFFGIGIPSFQVGGGILLLLMAISMLQARHGFVRQTPEEEAAAAHKEGIAIVPLSVPLLAGPGAISSMIIAAEHSGSFWGHVMLVLPVLIVALLVWGIFSISAQIAARLGTIGINIVTRLMGLILAAMAIEFISRGLGRLFPGLLA
ncbi:MAG: NAAT family transporter [Methylobacterium sp.]|nr:NAAT family transporter [Methylobacterium sp.]